MHAEYDEVHDSNEYFGPLFVLDILHQLHGGVVEDGGEVDVEEENGKIEEEVFGKEDLVYKVAYLIERVLKTVSMIR